MKRLREFSFWTMVLLIVLRLSIGWHFLFEGIHKLDSYIHGAKPFSSAGYFHDTPGPLADVMRPVVGDPDDEALARLTALPKSVAGPDEPSEKPYLRTPPALHKEWADYEKRFADAYSLDDAQRKEAESRLNQSEDEVMDWLDRSWDPSLQRQAPDDFGSTDDQLKKLNDRLTKLTADAALVSKRPDDKMKKADEEDIKEQLDSVNTDLAKFQTYKTIQNHGFRAVEKASPSGNGTINVLETPAERIADYRAKVQEYRAMLDQTDPAFGADVVGAKRQLAKADAAAMRATLIADLGRQAAHFRTSLASLLTPDQKAKAVTLAMPRPLSWWIDAITAWFLAIVGGCLLIGLLTRTNCVLAALFLLATYFMSPPWPWMPTPPNTEGNYLFVNKNVVEMFALLALAATASGRWFGVDALLHWMRNALFGRKKPLPTPVRVAA